MLICINNFIDSPELIMTKNTILIFLACCSMYACKANLYTFSKNQSLPEVECHGEIPEIVKQELGSYRLSKPSDFVSTIRNYADENPEKKLTCSIFSDDFNQDSLVDYALLSIAPDESQFRFMILINQNNINFEKAIIEDYKAISNSSSGIVYTSMSLKNSGERGLMERAYSPLKPNTSEGKIFEKNPAIELWDAIKLNQSDIPQDLELGTLSYCSKAFYFDKNQLNTFVVCD